MTLSLYIVVAIYSTVYSYRRLHRPGVSAFVRNLFVKKHVRYVVVFIVIWMVQQSNNYYFLFNPTAQGFSTDTESENFAPNLMYASSPNEMNLPPLRRFGTALGFHKKKFEQVFESSNDGTDTENDGPNFVSIVSGLMTFSTGIFLTLVRLYEPLFRVLILQLIYQFFGQIY